MSSGLRVSVVLPTYQGAGHIASCLRSLGEQVMSPSAYEVLVVQNGPRDGTEAVLAGIQADFPRLQLKSIQVSRPNAAHARNIGLAAARGTYVTFVDDDDVVSPGYLRALERNTGPALVGLAHMANVASPGAVPDFAAGATPWQLRQRERTQPPSRLPSALSYTAAKMLPTALARTVGFDPLLRSGEDIVFWAQVLARLPFRFGLCSVAEHAVYYRTLRANSVSRQADSYHFNVSQRLDVITRLEEVLHASTSPDLTAVVRHLQLGQVDFMNRYLRAHPDEHKIVIEDIRQRGLTTIPYPRLNAGVARDLAVLYAAPPFSDTSAIVAARRMREAEVVRDVISCDMSTQRSKDPELQAIWQEFAGEVAVLKTRPVSAWWPAVLDFCRTGLEQATRWEAVRGERYRSVYSRAMWPAAHLLGALYKARNPDTHWLAEFSDPLVRGITGDVRESNGRADQAILDELGAAMRERGFAPPEGTNMYVWLEYLAYALADTLLFTNPLQRDYMLGNCEDRALAQRALEHSRVDAHPTLPSEFYGLVESDYELDERLVNLAYFGVFYATRGLTEVVEALRTLQPAVRERVRLHVFTPKPEELRAEAREAGLDDVIVTNRYVSYLAFLSLTTRFDVLLVNDARAAEYHHGLNPYLPSKWSDYLGSGRPVWAVVEPGSVLSSLPTAYRSELGDAAGARAVLEQLVMARDRASSVRDIGSVPSSVQPQSTAAFTPQLS